MVIDGRKGKEDNKMEIQILLIPILALASFGAFTWFLTWLYGRNMKRIEDKYKIEYKEPEVTPWNADYFYLDSEV